MIRNICMSSHDFSKMQVFFFLKRERRSRDRATVILTRSKTQDDVVIFRGLNIKIHGRSRSTLVIDFHYF